MSTSNPAPTPASVAETDGWASGSPTSTQAVSGVFSPAELARIANELFRAIPDEIQQPAVTTARTILPSSSALTGNPYAAVPNPTAPAIPGIASGLIDAQPKPFVAHPERSIAPDLRPSALPVQAPSAPLISVPDSSIPISPPISSVPGAIPAASPQTGPIPADARTTPPAFAFLQDARPLYPASAAELEPLNTSSRALANPVPNDLGFASNPASLFTDLNPSSLAGVQQSPAPAIPDSLGVIDSSPISPFSFMEDARPLFSTPPSIPGLVPAIAAPFASPLDQNAPQLSGAVAHGVGFQPPAPSQSQDPIRPLDPSNFVPVVVPGSGQRELADGLGASDDLGLSSTFFDVEAIRRDFPILRERVNGRPLIWFDNGATTQKPQSVIDRISYFYEHENSNVHRAAHELAARATDAYESAREKTRRFLNAGSTREIVFVRGATEAINLVAQSWGRRNIQKDDEIVITWLEHHANIVPWQMLCAEKGARLRVAPVDDTGQILLDEYEKLLNPKTRLVSITHVSNALGTILPVKEMTEAAHRHGAPVLVDGAQTVSHMRVDVQAIDCDFYVFSGHKVFAPTGIGVVYGKSEVLDQMPPWQGGGNMIQDVTFEKTLYQPPPQRFEAGTGNIADAVGLGAAIDYLERVGLANVARHEHSLLTYATAALQRIPGLTIIGTASEKASVLSFVIEGLRTEEIGDYLNRRGIAVRGGHHCAQPILRRFGQESTVRATFALYNTREEVDALIAALWDMKQGRSPGPV
jgi:cysteine desulfurase / selenocysteine lyase